MMARARLRSVAAAPLVGLIRFYQLVISPWTVASCRYYPSCSQYALDAVRIHGVARGGWLAVRRIGRCHPWSAGGVDYVPGSARAEAVVLGAAETEPVSCESRARSLT